VGTRKRLLDTPADRVSPELASTVAGFCAPIGVIRAAYVGLIEVTPDFQAPVEHLGVAFELAEEAMDSAEAVREVNLVADRFYDEMPAEIQDGGCNFLDAGGAAVWAEKARRVYPRPADENP
jgi:hypothetical protein